MSFTLKLIVLPFILFFIESCINDESSLVYRERLTNSTDVYVEKHKMSSGGVYTGDTYRFYLSLDSTTANLHHVGTLYHDNEREYFKLEGHTFYMYKLVATNNIKKYEEDTVLVKKVDIRSLNKK